MFWWDLFSIFRYKFILVFANFSLTNWCCSQLLLDKFSNLTNKIRHLFLYRKSINWYSVMDSSVHLVFQFSRISAQLIFVLFIQFKHFPHFSYKSFTWANHFHLKYNFLFSTNFFFSALNFFFAYIAIAFLFNEMFLFFFFSSNFSNWKYVFCVVHRIKLFLWNKHKKKCSLSSICLFEFAQ